MYYNTFAIASPTQITTAEINMKNNFEIIYMIQGFLITIGRLYENIILLIKSNGHDMTNTKTSILKYFLVDRYKQ